jgi:hypothetical protein
MKIVPPEPPPEDPQMDAIVEDAVAPWRPLVPPDVFEMMRLRVAAALIAHPVGSLLMRAARPDPVVDESARVEAESAMRATRPDLGADQSVQANSPAAEAPAVQRRRGSA